MCVDDTAEAVDAPRSRPRFPVPLHFERFAVGSFGAWWNFRETCSVRAAEPLPWDRKRTQLNAKIFPQMANWLPEEEAAQLCFEFEVELARLDAA
jgi:hypothetical protein